MSWDVTLLRVRPGVAEARELSEEAIIPLGSRDTIREILRVAWPEIELDEDGYCWLAAPGGGRDLGIGLYLTYDPVDILIVRVYGYPNALDAIQQLCKHLDCRAVDLTSGEFIRFACEPAASLQRLQAFLKVYTKQRSARGELASAPEPDNADGGKKP